MSMAIAIPGFRGLGTDGSAAVSETSQAIKRRWYAEQNILRLSASDWLPPVSAAFHDISTKTSLENWDGHGAYAISPATRDIAYTVVLALYSSLPAGTPVPDIVAESDGEILISWVRDSDHAFSLSIGSHGKANYTGEFGREGSVHAWQPIDTSSWHALEESLEEIAQHVSKVFKKRARRSAA